VCYKPNCPRLLTCHVAGDPKQPAWPQWRGMPLLYCLDLMLSVSAVLLLWRAAPPRAGDPGQPACLRDGVCVCCNAYISRSAAVLCCCGLLLCHVQVIQDSQPGPNGEARPFYEYLESCLRHKVESVIFEVGCLAWRCSVCSAGLLLRLAARSAMYRSVVCSVVWRAAVAGIGHLRGRAT
jgi:hypothetical protein